MQAILYHKKYLNNDLLLNVLNEEGNIVFIKIPGIIKSTKRNVNLYTIGNILNLSFSKPPSQNISIPKEVDLVKSSTVFNTSYEDLLQMYQLIQPLLYLKQGDIFKEIYNLYIQVLNHWDNLNNILKEHFINYSYLYYLEFLGEISLFDISQQAYTYFTLGLGYSAIQTKESLPTKWMKIYYTNLFSDILKINYEFSKNDLTYRDIIILYLKSK